MLPLHQPRHDHALEVAEYPVERLALLRRRGGELAGDVSWLDVRNDAAGLDGLEVIGDPIHQGVSFFTKIHLAISRSRDLAIRDNNRAGSDRQIARSRDRQVARWRGAPQSRRRAARHQLFPTEPW